jgi:hypothetical protein
MRFIDQVLAVICKPGTGSGSEGVTSKSYRPDKLPDPGPVAKAEAETEFAKQEAGEIEEETLFVIEILTAASSSGRRRTGEGELNSRVNANRSAIGDETSSDAQSFEDAVSDQISDNDSSSFRSIRAEKQEIAVRTTLSMRRSG